MYRIIIRFLLKHALKLLFRVRVSGIDKPIHTEKLLVIANHESFLDGLLLGAFLPFDPVFVVHTGVLRNFWFRMVLSLVDYLAVDPTSPMAIKRIIKLMDEGRPVVIFPEGRITETGSLMKVYEGPAFVAARTGATILPVRLDGPARSYFSRQVGKSPRYLFPQVTISALATTNIKMPEGSTTKQRRRKAGEAMRKLMQQMIFESYPIQTLYGSLLHAMEIYGRNTHVLEDVKQIEYTYNELLKMTLALGRMVEKNSQPEECVGILMPNLAATVCMMIGASALNRTPAMLNYKAGTAGMQDACTAAKIKTVITSKAFIDQAKLEQDIAGLQGLNLLYVEDLREDIGLLDKLWVMYGLHFPHLIEKNKNLESIGVVLFTSGSEGKPKGVVLSHRAIMSNIAQIRSIIEFSVEDKVLNALPIFHSFGLTGGTLLPIMTGMKLFLYATPLHYRVIPEVAYDRSCSVLFGTSTFLANYAKFAHPYDFYRLRYVVAGAEKLATNVRDLWFEKFGIRILEGYGATETAPVMAVNTPMAYRSGTVGQFLPGLQHSLMPVQGIDNGGMLHVKGPNLMSGYYRFDNPGVLQPPSSEVGEGWYETGDVVNLDDDGFVSIVGRVKRFAKVAGEMVSLEVVEKIANSTSELAMHAATSQPDGARGEAIVLYTTDANLHRDALVNSAKRLGIPEISVPRKIRHVAALPLLGTGKTDYVTLKKMAETE